jgi:hypothetical protein
MSDVEQLRDDLHFVRSAVARRERTDTGPSLILYVWAAYVVIGYTLIDVRPSLAGPFLGIGGIVGGLLSWWIGRRYSRESGEWDRATATKGMLHFGGGIILGFIFTVSLGAVIGSLRGLQGSQVFVVMIGLVYFLWGVHYQRYFMLLGLVVMTGGVVVGLIPHYGWTMLGLVIALGLILPTIVPWRRFSVRVLPEAAEKTA